MSPAASSASSSSRAAGARNENHTEFFTGAQIDSGSSASNVASAVVARTWAGSDPSACGVARASLAGGAAAADGAAHAESASTARSTRGEGIDRPSHHRRGNATGQRRCLVSSASYSAQALMSRRRMTTMPAATNTAA
jgi:hypothetical protein